MSGSDSPRAIARHGQSDHNVAKRGAPLLLPDAVAARATTTSGRGGPAVRFPTLLLLTSDNDHNAKERRAMLALVSEMVVRAQAPRGATDARRAAGALYRLAR